MHDKGVNHVLSQARTALGEAAEMWQNLITLVQKDSPEADQHLEDFSKRIFDPQKPGQVSNNRRLKRLASLLGVSKKKARVVAEIFNPNRFGPHTKKHQLESGMAFDLTLGDDLLNSRTRQNVRQYIKTIKPGLVVISTPCTMLSQLQNLNMKHLTTETKQREFTRRLIQAKVLLGFSCEICELVREYGGTFILEQPRTSKAWKDSRVQKLASQSDVTFTVNDQCMFGLKSVEGIPHKKPTGWLCNNAMVAKALDRQCDHTHDHLPVFGSGPGGSRARKAQEYPPTLVNTILKAYEKSLDQPLERGIYVMTNEELENEIYHIDQIFHREYDIILKNEFNPKYDIAPENLKAPKTKDMKTDETVTENVKVPEDDTISKNVNATENVKVLKSNQALQNNQVFETMAADEESVEASPDGEQEEMEEERPEDQPWLPRERPLSVEQLVRRAHCGLGHIANPRLARILQQAGARKEAVDYAKTLQCDVCLRHKHTAPPRAAAPPRELMPNQIIGVDTIYLPGLIPGGKTKMALNILDWATRFQLVVPLQDHTPRAARQAMMHWTRIFGVPERIYDDLGKEFRGCFEMLADQEAVILDPGSLESPTQRSLTERAGKTYKEIFSRTLMEVSCNNWDEWHEAVTSSRPRSID
eukprot:s90_g58.t1